MKKEFAELTLDEEEEVVLEAKVEPNLEKEERTFRLVGCFLIANVIHFPAMKSTMENPWHPVRGVQKRFLCEAKMALGVEVAVMGWDLSLRVQSKRALAHYVMEHNLEERVLIGEEGKRKTQEESEDQKIREEGNIAMAKSRRLLDNTLLSSATAKSLRNPQTIRRLRHTLKTYNPKMVFFMKTKINKIQMERVQRSCGLANGIDVDPDGSRAGLWLAWRGDVPITLQNFSKRHIDILIEDPNDGKKWKFIGLPRDERRMEVFRNVLEYCHMMDVGYSANWFTWERRNLPERNIQERLDRGVANENWRTLGQRSGQRELDVYVP
ncbi:hypothetical protein J1N35_025928 [Gossypium stocksii]|uniref:Uncharacterized protein n=1 Tax=Gossypium stocksii TaxID=47602 RepID=A0A9D3V7S2_9ROSI|nr:hypothetical protein J1N35_025928 [Gossypium stocksii]